MFIKWWNLNYSLCKEYKSNSFLLLFENIKNKFLTTNLRLTMNLPTVTSFSPEIRINFRGYLTPVPPIS